MLGKGRVPKDWVPTKIYLPWEDLVALKEEAIRRELTLGEIVSEALHARLILVRRPRDEKVGND